MAQSDIQTFGKYQILELIATGGMAEIYKARLEGIGGFQRTFAIKRILPNLSQNSEYIAMLVDEAKVAGLLSHANIVQILDLGQVEGIWYIAMEYVHGRDMGAVLRRARSKGLTLPVPHSVFTAIELLKGLEYAHQRQVMRGGKPVALNIIHRDVSPPNILLSFQGEVKLTDFGIARASLKAMETVSGVVRGRFDYMSPEQAAGSKDLDQRSDLFSVGVVLYETLTGVHPFRADNEIATIERIRTGQYVNVSKRNPEVPFALETIVDRALRVDRAERYPSATAFKEALDKFFHDSGFIFTHATLAAYVKGLFPEANPKPPTGTPAPRRVKHRRGSNEDTEDVELEPEGTEVPTRLQERPSIPGMPVTPRQTPTAARPLDNEVSAHRPSPLVALPGFGDDSEARRIGEWEDDVATALRPNPFGEEQETVIRKMPLPVLEAVSEGPATTKLERSSGERPRVKSSQPPRPRERVPSPVGWFGWLLAVFALFTGLALGAGSVVVVGAIAGMRPGAATASDARIRVSAPQGTAVLLDGDAIGGEAPAAAGPVHKLEIRCPGTAPVRQEITLQPGEIRVIVVQPVPLQPAPPSADAKAPKAPPRPAGR